MAGQLEAGFVYTDLTPLMRYDANGNPVYYLEDAMGSVIGLANETGVQTASFRYDGYGNILSQTGQTGTTLPGAFRFQGAWLDGMLPMTCS